MCKAFIDKFYQTHPPSSLWMERIQWGFNPSLGLRFVGYFSLINVAKGLPQDCRWYGWDLISFNPASRFVVKGLIQNCKIQSNQDNMYRISSLIYVSLLFALFFFLSFTTFHCQSTSTNVKKSKLFPWEQILRYFEEISKR